MSDVNNLPAVVPLNRADFDPFRGRKKALSEDLWVYDPKARVFRYPAYGPESYYEVDPERALTRRDSLDWLV